MQRSAFTMIELIFVIVILGILATMAVPKFKGMSDNAKKSAELATVSAVTTALEAANGEWSINEGDFEWGNRQSTATNPLNSKGYPTELGTASKPFGFLLKSSTSVEKFKVYNPTPGGADYSVRVYTGPASDPAGGAKFQDDAPGSDISGKPDKNDFWLYASEVNSTLACRGQSLYSGDFILIDVTGKGMISDYTDIAELCP